MLVHQHHRLSTIRSFQNYGVALRVFEHASHSVAYQHMVVDDKNLHKSLFRPLRAPIVLQSCAESIIFRDLRDRSEV